MGNRYGRREFLRKGAGGAGAAAAFGLGGAALEPRREPASSRNPSSRRAPGPSGVTDHRAPKRGGTLTIGTWSEVNGLSPPSSTWDETGLLYGNAIFDTLTQIGANGKVYPYLAKSFAHNRDYTVWAFEVRPHVEFHNGGPCNASAIANSLEAVKNGYITGQSLKPIEKISTSGDTVSVRLSQPWPAFSSYLAGQLGYICAPEMLKSADQGSLKPIGTGPFRFESWEPNSHLNTRRNPHYWQPGYPYLDRLVFKPLPDNTERADALLAKTVNVIHCQAPRTIKPFFGNPNYQTITGTLPSRAEPDVDFIMLNLDSPPVNDLELRRALAMAIDTEVLRETYGDGLIGPMSGPYLPGEIWYTHTSYPRHDPRGAKKLVEEYKKRTGNTNPEVKLTTIIGPQYAQVVQLVQENWQAAGVKTTVGQIDFTAFVTDSVLGDYQACTFEQFGATDPDQNYIWWSTESYAKIGAVALNMARNRDARLQAALTKGRESSDTAVRARAYQDVSRYLAEDLPYLWLGRTYWAAIADHNVVGVTGQVLPDRAKSIGFDSGVFLVHELAFTK
ncbi:MAG: ABC transporter substrate-binding protein [Acidimicrobiales bacterium]